eukprot:gene19235-939_t
MELWKWWEQISIFLELEIDQDDFMNQLDLWLNRSENVINNEEKNPMKFWNNGGVKYGKLALCARQLLSQVPSEASVERSFSVHGFILGKLRHCLKQENLEMLIFIKMNYPVVKKWEEGKKTESKKRPLASPASEPRSSISSLSSPSQDSAALASPSTSSPDPEPTFVATPQPKKKKKTFMNI